MIFPNTPLSACVSFIFQSNQCADGSTITFQINKGNIGAKPLSGSLSSYINYNQIAYINSPIVITSVDELQLQKNDCDGDLVVPSISFSINDNFECNAILGSISGIPTGGTAIEYNFQGNANTSFLDTVFNNYFVYNDGANPNGSISGLQQNPVYQLWISRQNNNYPATSPLVNTSGFEWWFAGNIDPENIPKENKFVLLPDSTSAIWDNVWTFTGVSWTNNFNNFTTIDLIKRISGYDPSKGTFLNNSASSSFDTNNYPVFIGESGWISPPNLTVTDADSNALFFSPGDTIRGNYETFQKGHNNESPALVLTYDWGDGGSGPTAHTSYPNQVSVMSIENLAQQALLTLTGLNINLGTNVIDTTMQFDMYASTGSTGSITGYDIFKLSNVGNIDWSNLYVIQQFLFGFSIPTDSSISVISQGTNGSLGGVGGHTFTDPNGNFTADLVGQKITLVIPTIPTPLIINTIITGFIDSTDIILQGGGLGQPTPIIWIIEDILNNIPYLSSYPCTLPHSSNLMTTLKWIATQTGTFFNPGITTTSNGDAQLTFQFIGRRSKASEKPADWILSQNPKEDPNNVNATAIVVQNIADNLQLQAGYNNSSVKNISIPWRAHKLGPKQFGENFGEQIVGTDGPDYLWYYFNQDLNNWQPLAVTCEQKVAPATSITDPNSVSYFNTGVTNVDGTYKISDRGWVGATNLLWKMSDTNLGLNADEVYAPNTLFTLGNRGSLSARTDLYYAVNAILPTGFTLPTDEHLTPPGQFYGFYCPLLAYAYYYYQELVSGKIVLTETYIGMQDDNGMISTVKPGMHKQEYLHNAVRDFTAKQVTINPILSKVEVIWEEQFYNGNLPDGNQWKIPQITQVAGAGGSSNSGGGAGGNSAGGSSINTPGPYVKINPASHGDNNFITPTTGSTINLEMYQGPMATGTLTAFEKFYTSASAELASVSSDGSFLTSGYVLGSKGVFAGGAYSNDPLTTLSVSGDFSFAEETTIALTNPTENNIAIGTNSYVRFTCSQDMNITGFVSNEITGKLLYCFFDTAHKITFKSQNAGSITQNQIFCTNTDTTPPYATAFVATFLYDENNLFWNLVSITNTTFASPYYIGGNNFFPSILPYVNVNATDAMAMGDSASALGNNSVAINQASASGVNSLAMMGASAVGRNTIAIGNTSFSKGNGSITIGSATAYGGSIAIGTSVTSDSTSLGSIVIGNAGSVIIGGLNSWNIGGENNLVQGTGSDGPIDGGILGGANNLLQVSDQGIIIGGLNNSVGGQDQEGIILGISNTVTGSTGSLIINSNTSSITGSGTNLFEYNLIGGSTGSNIYNSTGSVILGGTNNSGLTTYNSALIGGHNNTSISNNGGVIGGSYNVGIYESNIILGGTRNTTNGFYSVILGGIGNYTHGHSQVVLGYNNVVTLSQSTSATASKDILFIIGNGGSSATTSNSFTVNNLGGIALTSSTASYGYLTLNNIDGAAVGTHINKKGEMFPETQCIAWADLTISNPGVPGVAPIIVNNGSYNIGAIAGVGPGAFTIALLSANPTQISIQATCKFSAVGFVPYFANADVVAGAITINTANLAGAQINSNGVYVAIFGRY